MEKKIDLECDYCGVAITENDHKCPNCGANCTSKIKKYKEQQEKLKEEEMQRKMEQSEEVTKRMQNTMIIPFVFIVGIAILITIFMILSMTSAKKNVVGKYQDELEEKEEVVEVGYKETAKMKNYNFILDSYELYEYTSDSFPDQFNTPEGYQKIAFHFQYENTSSSSYHLIYDVVELTADDYKVESSKLETGTFEKVVTGKASYPEFSAQIIRDGEKFQGYVGFLVPKDKKELKFRFENVKIIMDNPVYEGE